MYNFYMEPIEISYIVVMSALIFACLWSFILIAALGSGRIVKIVFCVVSALSLLINIFLVLVWTGIIPPAHIESLVELKTTIFAPILAFVLTAISVSEFAGLLLMRDKCNAADVHEQLIQIAATQECFVPDNERKADERKHAEYKIIDMGE